METSGFSSQTQDHSQVHRETEDLDSMFAFSDPLGKATWEVESSSGEILLSSCGTMAQVTVGTSRKVVILRACTHMYVWACPGCFPSTFLLWGPSVAPQISRMLWGLGLALRRVPRRESFCMALECRIGRVRA